MTPPDAPSGPAPGPSDASPGEGRRGRLLRRLGLAGFLFFLAKGLVWLGVLALVALGVRC